jgi:hypothetical protein
MTEEEASIFMPFDDEVQYNIHVTPKQLLEKGFVLDRSKSRNDIGTFDAQVISVKPLQTHESPHRTVTWKVDNPYGNLGPQMYTNVLVKAKLPRRVLCVPKEAIKDNNKVFIERNGVLTFREVKTGIYDDKHIEISGGLSNGDVAIISGVSLLSPGSKVKVTLLHAE